MVDASGRVHGRKQARNQHVAILAISLVVVAIACSATGFAPSGPTIGLKPAVGVPSSPVPTLRTISALDSTSSVPRTSSSLPSEVRIIPAHLLAPEICANGTPANPFPVSFLPYGYETPNLFGLGSGSVGTDHICYTGGAHGDVSNRVHFSSVGGAGGVLGFPHVEYGQDLWGGSPGTMAPGFTLPEKDSAAAHQAMWLTNSYAIHDSGQAAYDYVWDNFLSSYIPNPANVSGPGNFSLEIMLWMTTGYEGSPWSYFTDYGSTDLPTLINTTVSSQPWAFSYFCQGFNNNELTVLYFYNGTGGMVNATSRTFGVNFSAVLVNVNDMIHRTHESCWSYPANGDSKMYLDDLNLGSEFLTPWPSPYYGTAVFYWTISSMCFRFPRGTPTASSVSCG
ncbi:MAG TPA: hypothetical protein VEK13_05960 [Thermoplasmata archaeon]|nr:hypothetical protein [Thermoplasmata archaeon]